MIELHPTKCNLCGGRVILTSNACIYGTERNSGSCYLCQSCGAYVGTHPNQPQTAMGILANDEMRELRIKCHGLFEGTYKNNKERSLRYGALAKKLGIPWSDCHFGHMDLETLKRAYAILEGEANKNDTKK